MELLSTGKFFFCFVSLNPELFSLFSKESLGWILLTMTNCISEIFLIDFAPYSSSSNEPTSQTFLSFLYNR